MFDPFNPIARPPHIWAAFARKAAACVSKAEAYKKHVQRHTAVPASATDGAAWLNRAAYLRRWLVHNKNWMIKVQYKLAIDEAARHRHPERLP